MTYPSVTIQVNPRSVPSTPSWMGEVAAVAQVLTHVGLLKAIQEHVRFARARFGIYDTIDFVVVLLGYALSGERSLTAYYHGSHRSPMPSWPSLAAIVCQIVQPSPVFLPHWIK